MDAGNLIQIRRLAEEDTEMIYRVFCEHEINKPLSYLIRCWEENATGVRTTLLAFYKEQFAGSLHLLDHSGYPYFADNGIPEINDFNVISPLRRLGIGSELMEAAERLAFESRHIVGIGVGLYASYGSAQRLYARRGFIPDGRGIMYRQQPAAPGELARVDDDLNLYFTKSRPEEQGD